VAKKNWSHSRSTLIDYTIKLLQHGVALLRFAVTARPNIVTNRDHTARIIGEDAQPTITCVRRGKISHRKPRTICPGAMGNSMGLSHSRRSVPIAHVEPAAPHCESGVCGGDTASGLLLAASRSDRSAFATPERQGWVRRTGLPGGRWDGGAPGSAGYSARSCALLHLTTDEFLVDRRRTICGHTRRLATPTKRRSKLFGSGTAAAATLNAGKVVLEKTLSGTELTA
jgi:hypothetical protein